MLSEKELEFFKKELESMKLKIENNLARGSFEINALMTNQPRDEGDYASVARSHTIVTTLIDKQKEKLEAIERSLKRIEEGTYGICDACEEEISIERLKVKAFADYCISCREVIEKREG